MNKTIIGGFVSVKSVLEAKSREVFKIFIEKERFDKIMRSDLRVPEQRQYNALINSGAEIEYVSSEEFGTIMQNASAGGIAAEIGDRIFTPSEEILSLKNGYIVILDGIEDPFNFGYVLRSLYLSGCDGVILPQRNFFTSDDIVVRASAGTSELLDISLCDDISEYYETIKNKNIKIICTGKEGSISIYDANLRKPLLLVIGGERRGISKSFAKLSDSVIEIPYGIESNISLSASSAASILAFEVFRNNRKN
jgi:23S rRNA (guanosine2251-2'-O)-methyltransferase